jgi:putative sigma-54 modulation protein
MNTKITSVHFNADAKLLEFINVKVNKLAHLYIEIINAEVFLRLENVQDPDNKIVEIKLFLPGTELFAKKQSKTFEEAADNVMDALKSQIDKHKTKVRK